VGELMVVRRKDDSAFKGENNNWEAAIIALGKSRGSDSCPGGNFFPDPSYHKKALNRERILKVHLEIFKRD